MFEISAARGEVECFQVGIHARGIHPNYVRAEVSDLKGPGGATIPGDCVDVLYPEYVPVKWQTGGQSPGDVERISPAFFPDPLLPEWILNAAGTVAAPSRAIWLRVRVPPDAAPGVYRATATVTAGRRDFKAENQAKSTQFEKSARVGFRLRVWDFSLPERTRLLTTNWFFHDHLADWYRVALWSPGYWRLIEKVAEDMAAHRQNVIKVPFFGGRNAEEQLVGVRRRGRKYDFDFGGLDRWFRIFLGHGFELIEGQHVAARSREPFAFWLTSSMGGAKLVSHGDATDPGFEDFLGQFIRSLWTHLGKRGWQERFVQHISDEPALPELGRFRRLAELMRAAAPGIRFIDALTDAQFADVTEYPVPLESTYERVVRDSRCPRENVWTYYCCGPGGAWPNRFIEYLPIRWRIITWICFQKRIPGFLHWGYNFWAGRREKTLSPWDDTTANRWPGGDPCVVYPPPDGLADRGVIYGSIRWEILREALEDHEYLVMTRDLAEAGNGEARAILRDVEKRVVRDWTTHTRDWKLMEGVRRRIGELLSRERGTRAPGRSAEGRRRERHRRKVQR